MTTNFSPFHPEKWGYGTPVQKAGGTGTPRTPVNYAYDLYRHTFVVMAEKSLLAGIHWWCLIQSQSDALYSAGCTSVSVFMSVLGTVMRPSRALHVLPGVRLPRRQRVSGARRHRVEDALVRRVLHRPYQSSVSGRRRGTAAHLGDE